MKASPPVCAQQFCKGDGALVLDEGRRGNLGQGDEIFDEPAEFAV
jgi:hypothetical protein